MNMLSDNEVEVLRSSPFGPVLLKCVALLLSALFVGAAHAESLIYELYAIEQSGRRLMSSGTKEHTPSDTVLKRKSADRTLDKELRLGNGFAVGVSDYAEARITGLGFWLRRIPSPMEASSFDGFSWEWFDRSQGDVFEKRKGSGRIELATTDVGNRQRVTRVRFLDDVTFQMNGNESHEPGTYTHELLIRKGSVLAFAPEP